MSMIFTKQEVINELSKLYCLKAEGKNVRTLIKQYEELLCKLTDDELDSEEVDEED